MRIRRNHATLQLWLPHGWKENTAGIDAVCMDGKEKWMNG
jgi:hypothetical protein